MNPSPPWDWRSSLNDNLWQGVDGINNPCPDDFRLPTAPELDAERLTWSDSTPEGAFGSPLKLPSAGTRESWNGTLMFEGEGLYYWSSTVNGEDALFLTQRTSIQTSFRAIGYSVRCIRNF